MDLVRFYLPHCGSLVMARWALWLKHWSSDSASKQALCSIPFSGDTLLDKMLEEKICRVTGGKSSLLPQDQKRRLQSFKTNRRPQNKFKDARSYCPGREFLYGEIMAPLLITPNLKPLRLPKLQPTNFEGRPTQESSVGARLSIYSSIWAERIKDSWVLDVVRNGLHLQFQSSPPRRFFVSTKIPTSSEKRVSHEAYILWRSVHRRVTHT